MGFFLKFYGAQHIVFDFDERINNRVAKNISFDSQNLRLPLVDREPEGILSERYLMRIGQDLFGESLIGSRMPCIIIATLTILLVYLITVGAFGFRAALIAAFLVSVSPYTLAITRKVSVESFLIFFSILSIYLFFRAISRGSKCLMLLSGLAMGAGFWFKESMFFLIPIYAIFLMINPQYRSWLKNKYLWLSFLMAFCLALPLILACLHPEAQRFSYIYHETILAPSLNSLGLYAGEIIAMIMKLFPALVNYAAFTIDPQCPAGEAIPLGLLILLAGFVYRVRKDSLAGLLKVCFLFNFVLFCFLRRNDMLQSIWHLGSLTWGIIGFTPGMILAAVMVDDFMSRHIRWGRILFCILAAFLFFRAWSMAVYPLDCFFPLQDYCLQNRKLQWEIDEKLGEGDREAAKEQLRIVYEVTAGNPAYQQKAAYRLAELLVQEHNYAEARKYLDFVLFKDPGHDPSLELLEQIKNDNRDH